jgi:hypothetical protein
LKLNVESTADLDIVKETLPYNELLDNVVYSNIVYNPGDLIEDENNSHWTGIDGETKQKENVDLCVIELLKDFEEKNKNGEWPQSTHIHCYWCTHAFNNVPYGIPLKYINNKFHVYGCFCSLECACAYNFDSKDSQDEIWERYNLINLIGKKLGFSTIKAAPTRLALSIFGGHLSIDNFRAYCKTNKVINVNFPPMMTLTQQIEELNETDVNSDFKYIPVDTDRINKYKDKMNLKRNKPVNINHTTLDNVMNLKFG